MADLTALAIRDKESIHQSSEVNHSQLNDAISVAATARVELREHVDEHRCWSHSVYSSLFFLWRSQWADAIEASDELSKLAS
jgi:hypothetical protein